MHLIMQEKCMSIQMFIIVMKMAVRIIIVQKPMEACIALSGIRISIKTGITMMKMRRWQEEQRRLVKLPMSLITKVFCLRMVQC